MKQRVLTDVKIECELPHIPYWEGRTQEARAKYLERWASDFNDFIRDHRSQDQVSLSIERVFEDQCSHCKRTWEVDVDGPVCCDKAFEEWKAAIASPASI